ncbi:MAG: hypothetical protein NZ551_01065 [Microscillaceae bacterium]|nr:hypothetical protein [Microscillaceae bacterium]MDW8459779.1 hypothetical protein [Cytophagales bacterium]
MKGQTREGFGAKHRSVSEALQSPPRSPKRAKETPKKLFSANVLL